MTFNLCTYFDYHYVYKGLALIHSLQRHCPGHNIWILALCERSERVLKELGISNVISLEDFETVELLAVKPSRTWLEYIWTCTPSWMLHVMEKHGLDHVAYIDADCFFFDSPQAVVDEVLGTRVAITPHRFPQRHMHYLDSGIYNVGMVYVEREGIPCIEEWRDLCLEWCFFRHEPDHPERYCDQKYWDQLVPKYEAHPIEHLGANLAPWNVEGYAYSYDDDYHFLIDGHKLIWYHFHGFQMDGELFRGRYPSPYFVPGIAYEYIYDTYERALEHEIERVRSIS